MIVFRQKEYTRGERAAFRELYRLSKGFKELPKSTHPRDVRRFDRLALDIDEMLKTGNTQNFDREGAKTLLNNLGLKKGAKEVDRLVDKYGNKEAIDRLVAGRRGISNQTFNIKPYWKRRFKKIKKTDYDFKRDLRTAKNAIESQVGSRVLSKFDIDKKAKEAIIDKGRRNNIRVDEIDIPEVRNRGALATRLAPGSNKTIKRDELFIKKVGEDKNYYKSGNGGLVGAPGNYDGQIIVPNKKKTAAAILGHEAGHLDKVNSLNMDRSMLSNYVHHSNDRKLDKINNAILTLANENHASSKSLAELNRFSQMNPASGRFGKLKRKIWEAGNKRTLDKAGKTYLDNSVKEISRYR